MGPGSFVALQSCLGLSSCIIIRGGECITELFFGDYLCLNLHVDTISRMFLDPLVPVPVLRRSTWMFSTRATAMWHFLGSQYLIVSRTLFLLR
jgi:hypothetical protein